MNKKFWQELIAHFPLYDTDRMENGASNSLFPRKRVYQAII
jgi:hypothetical protein